MGRTRGGVSGCFSSCYPGRGELDNKGLVDWLFTTDEDEDERSRDADEKGSGLMARRLHIAQGAHGFSF